MPATISGLYVARGEIGGEPAARSGGERDAAVPRGLVEPERKAAPASASQLRAAQRAQLLVDALERVERCAWTATIAPRRVSRLARPSRCTSFSPTAAPAAASGLWILYDMPRDRRDASLVGSRPNLH